MRSSKTPKHSAPLQFDALGTHWWIELPGYDGRDIEKDILLIVREFESTYSRFRADSLISTLNDQKILANPPSELTALLKRSLDYYYASDGLFNISVGAKLEQDGYGVAKDDRARISQKLYKDILLRDDEIKLSSTTRIDLGGIGKGWLIDELSAFLEGKSANYIINGGGDMRIHTPKPTRIALEHPFDSTYYIGTIKLTKAGFGASSLLKRQWQKNGQTKSHIVTDMDAEFVASYVAADTATDADVMATVLLIANEDVRVKLSNQYNLEWLLIRSDLSYLASSGFRANLH